MVTGPLRTARSRALGAAVGLLADRLVGEPPAAVHPVARFGSAMAHLEERWWDDDRLAGGRYALAGIGGGAAAGAVVSLALRSTGRAAPELASSALATTVAVAGRALAEAAAAVEGPLDTGDLVEARRLLPALVGRDPAGLDEKELARAVVESVAENTVDAVVAPALWAAVAGAPGALGYRAANTLDAMVGHRTDRHGRFGWASARADDVANWVPARVTALLVLACRPRRARAIWRAVCRDAPGHPSPNAGVAEAAFAAALGLRLGGRNRYGSGEEIRATLGDGRPAEPDDIARAVRLSRDVTGLLAAILAAPALLPGLIRILRRRAR